MKLSLKQRIAHVFRDDPRLKYILGGFVGFTAVVAAVTCRAVALPDNKDYFNAFWLGITGAFWEDLVFFVLLGAVALLITLNRPGDEGFESRVRYFFNGKHVTLGARAHISQEMKRLGIFSPSYAATITFSEVKPELSAAKATFQIDRTVVNMFKDQEFEDEKHEYMFASDNVENVEVQGQLLDAYLGLGPDRTHLLPAAIDIGDSPLERTAQFTLPPDGEVHFGFRSWTWFKFGEDYKVVPARYTELITINVVNSCGAPLRLRCSRENAEVILTEGASRTYTFQRAPGAQPIAVFALVGVQAQ